MKARQNVHRWAAQHPKTMAIALAATVSWVGGVTLWAAAMTHTAETLAEYRVAKREREIRYAALQQAQSIIQAQAQAQVPNSSMAVMTSTATASDRPEWIFPELFRGDFPSLGSPRLNTQVRLYAAYLALFGPPDILIVGSSRSLQGIDPATLQAELSQRGYPDVRVYNFSVNGATAQVVDVIVRQILHPDQLPDLILWGDGSRAFNSGRNDATHEQIVASPGYQQILAGDRPIPYKAFEPDVASACSEFPPLPEQTEAAPFIGDFAAPDLTQDAVRRGCDRPSQPSTRLRRWERDRLTLQQRWIDQYGNGLNRLGFHTVTERFDPNRYYQRYSRVPGAYDSSYVPFQLNGVQTSATMRLAQYLQSQNIPLVAVNLPLSSDYLDYSRQRWEGEFREHMIKLAQQQNFVFRDLNQVELRNNNYFADPSHLNVNGAQVVARVLAQDTSLPWAAVLESRL